MRSTLLLLLFFYISNLGHSQDPSFYSDKGYSFLYSDKDSSYSYFQKAIKGYNSLEDIDNKLAAYFGLMYANGYYYDLKSYKKNLTRYEYLIRSSAARKSTYFEYFKDRLYLEKMNYHFKLSDYNTTQQYIDSLTEFQKLRNLEGRDADYYDYALKAGLYQGSIYKNQNKFNLALDKYEQLEGFILRHKDSMYDYKNANFSIKRLKAKVYASLGEKDRAILNQLEALKVVKNDPEYSNSELDLQLDLLSNLIAAREFQEAEGLINLLDQKNIEKAIFKISLLDQKIALSRLQKKNTINTSYHHQKIIAIKEYRQTDAHPALIAAYIDYSGDLTIWKDFDSAFAKLKTADSLISPSKNLNNLQLTKLQLDLDAQYLETCIKFDCTEFSATEILTKTKDIIRALDDLQPQFESKLDKQYLIDTTYPALQNAFVLMYKLFKNTGNRDYLDQAFAISEKSKAIELRTIRQAGIAQRSLDIDPKIIETENLFNYKINQLEREQFTSAEIDPAIQDSLLVQKEAFGDFINELRDKHPDYYKLRYHNDIATLPQCMDYQLENTATLSFFQVQETMYVLIIEKRDSTIIKISYPVETQQKVREYYEAISRLNVRELKKSDVLGSELFDLLIKPIFPDKLPESLTIIPDGLLHYIPFEALRIEGDYFVMQSTISYKPSVSFHQGRPLDTVKRVDFFGFAPNFNNTNSHNLSPLFYNEEEVEKAEQYYKGTLFKGDEASLVRFRESVKNNITSIKTPIYHLATHAITNDTLPEYSYLAFSPNGTKENYILYAKDLYTEDLNGAMVVLSACETGLGKLENGQGMQSLAQGFTYGGASSLLYSKWNVSDRYTADMMSLFYKYLDAGLHKDKALQKAKIEYLEITDDPNLKHPFYWASFVFSGDTVPLVSSAGLPVWVWILIALVGIGILILLLKKRFTG